jgi:hypothetical protein
MVTRLSAGSQKPFKFNLVKSSEGDWEESNDSVLKESGRYVGTEKETSFDREHL